MIYFIYYLVIINLFTALVTFLDKFFAKKKMRRVPEITLFTLALLGGAAAEYAVMKIIRHKTLHKRFMLGLPAIILLQLGAAVLFIIN
ncbi:MAG: DUF1294 domain-containing protein [Clostridia bacterium]|nr:DUF1294 domain-containing protein [Clostridia bacterium]